MRRLRPEDGPEPHRRAARYHLAACKKGGADLHKELHAEMSATYAALKTKLRDVEDASDDLVSAGADADFAEEALENLIRDIDADAAKADRDDPALGIQKTVFPRGFGAEIDPEGGAQLTILPKLRTRLSSFSAVSWVPEAIAKLDAAGEELKGTLTAQATADEKVKTILAEEREARRDIREQLESANGRLRSFYKARPALAEKFFLRDKGSGRKPAKGPAGSGKPGGAAGEKAPA